MYKDCQSHQCHICYEKYDRQNESLVRGDKYMQCPKCDCQLKRGIDKNSNTEVDYCSQCKGIWLDENELQVVCKFSAWQISLPQNAVLSQRFCPCCEIEMYEFNYPETTVKVEMCPGCYGFWMDSGEIKEIELVRKL